MKRASKISGLILIGILLLILFTLRLTGLEPPELEGEELRAHHDINRPGLWLKGELVTTPVTDWSFVNKPGAARGTNTIMVETRTPYFIPHSVRTAALARNGQLYIPSRQGCPIALHGDACEKYIHEYNRMDVAFPKNKFWTSNVGRDPRVRLKIDGKLYDVTLVLVTDRAEATAIFGRDPESREIGPGGQEHIVGYTHIYHVFQRNVPEVEWAETWK